MANTIALVSICVGASVGFFPPAIGAQITYYSWLTLLTALSLKKVGM